jgi:integrase
MRELRFRVKSAKEVHPIPDREMKRLLYYSYRYDAEFGNLVRFIRLTGARIKETLRLRWEDVSFDTETIWFRNKTDISQDDYIGMTFKIRKLLRYQEKIGIDAEYIFRWNDRSTSFLVKQLNKVYDKVGINITGESWHRIRKTFTNEAVELLPLDKAQKICRHRNISTTLNHYRALESKNIMSELDNARKNRTRNRT